MSTNFNKRAAVLKRHSFQWPLDDRKDRKLDVERHGLKRPNKAEAFAKSRVAKKKIRQDGEKVGSGEFNEEGTDSSSEDEDLVEVVHREPTSYDHLLKRLGSQNESVANALRRRKKEEEGESDTDEDVDNELEYSIEAEEKDDDDDESPHDLKGSETDVGMKLSEDIGKDDDDNTLSNTDEESDLMVNDQSLAEASVDMSTFDKHLNYKLSSREVEDLLKRKWSYTWKLPALNLKNCNWRGTGECFVKDLDVNSYYGPKPKLYTHWLEIYKASGGCEFHQSKQKLFLSLCESSNQLFLSSI